MLSELSIWHCCKVWHRPAATAVIQSPMQELPYAAGEAIKRKKKKKISRQAPAPGLPGSQLYPPASQHQLQETSGPSALESSLIYQKASRSFVTTQTKQSAVSETGPTYQKASTSSKTTRALQQKSQDLALPASKAALVPESPGPWYHSSVAL